MNGMMNHLDAAFLGIIAGGFAVSWYVDGDLFRAGFCSGLTVALLWTALVSWAQNRPEAIKD